MTSAAEDPTTRRGSSSYTRGTYRAQRKPSHVVPAENISMNELESHYKRLQRIGKGNPWNVHFSARPSS